MIGPIIHDLAINLLLLLWLVVDAPALLAALRGRPLLHDGLRNGAIEFIYLLPRIPFVAVAVMLAKP